MTTNGDDRQRWICAQCADFDYLNDDGLCRTCASDSVAEFYEIAMRVACGEPEKMERVWRIG